MAVRTRRSVTCDAHWSVGVYWYPIRHSLRCSQQRLTLSPGHVDVLLVATLVVSALGRCATMLCTWSSAQQSAILSRAHLHTHALPLGCPGLTVPKGHLVRRLRSKSVGVCSRCDGGCVESPFSLKQLHSRPVNRYRDAVRKSAAGKSHVGYPRRRGGHDTRPHSSSLLHSVRQRSTATTAFKPLCHLSSHWGSSASPFSLSCLVVHCHIIVHSLIDSDSVRN